MTGGRPARDRAHLRQETRRELAARLADAYGLVLVLILITFVVMMTLPPEGSGGRVAALAVGALTAIVGLTSSDARPGRVRLALAVAVAVVVAGAIAEAIQSKQLLSVAFVVDSVLLAIAAATILRRVVVGASRVDSRTILGAISVYTLIGLLFAFFYLAYGRWSGSPFFTGMAAPQASDYLFFSYTTLTTTGCGDLVRRVPSGSPSQSSRC